MARINADYCIQKTTGSGNCRAGASPADGIARQPGTVALQETAIAMLHGLVPIFTDYRVVLNCSRWQTIAGESRDSLEESPNTIRQHAA